MASIKTKESLITGILNNMVANTGSSRTDEYFFQANDLQVDDLYDRAFQKKILLTVTLVNSIIYKFSFFQLLS